MSIIKLWKSMGSTVNKEETYLHLFRFLMMSKHRVIELGAEYGLTGMQTTTIFLLDKPKPMNSFRKVFNCDASNVTGLVDGLEQKQLASRYESPTDRRIKMVQLEPKGKKIRTALLRKLNPHDSPLLSKLNSDEQKVFFSLIRKMTSGSAQF
jgi:DNA-binding MarR family transcriptional regulator